MRKYLKCFRISLFASIFVVGAYLFRTRLHALALKRYEIRIFAATNDDQQNGENLCDGAYKALLLLEQYDKEIFDRVKKHIRIISFFSPDPRPSNRPCCVPTGGLYFLNLLYFPVDFPLPEGTLPIAVAGLLAYQATLAKSKGCMAHFDKVNGAAILEMCRKEQFRTMQKLEQVLQVKLFKYDAGV